MKNSNRQVAVKLNEVAVLALKDILHQVEQQKAKRNRKHSTANGDRQLKFMEGQNEEEQN